MRKIYIISLLALSVVLGLSVSCKKEEGGKNASPAKEGYLKAEIQMSPDLVSALETIQVEYKDASGKLIKENVNATSLPTKEYSENLDLYVYKKEVKFNKLPSEVYFKVNVTKKTSHTYTDKVTFIYLPNVTSGITDVEFREHKGFADQLKINVQADKADSILSTLIESINSATAEGTVQ